MEIRTAVILAGGLGTRLAELTEHIPKPMVRIGSKPVLQHLVDSFVSQGVTNILILAGYRQEVIKQHFAFHALSESDISVVFPGGNVEPVNTPNPKAPHRVTVLDTGLETMTGGRLKRARRYLEGMGPFFFTYGDGLSAVDLEAEAAFHRQHKKLATVLAVIPPSRFGTMELENGLVTSFVEKPSRHENRINGGFFILDDRIFDYIDGDSTVFEQGPLARLVADGQLMAYKFDGFWQCMDTIRDVEFLRNLVGNRVEPWIH